MEIFLVFEEDAQQREIPIIVKGGNMSEEYIAESISKARAVITGEFDITQLERVIFVKDRIINFDMKKPKKGKK